jgi:hypothetical protein
MKTVTLSTAMRLKGAGFPQPNEATGQHWYKYDTLFYITNSDGRGSVCAPIDEDFTGPRIFYKRDAIFAPDAMRIMLELYGYKIGIGEDSYYHVTSAVYWEEDEDGNDCYSGGFVVASHENPAEAAALAWLSIYEKP